MSKILSLIDELIFFLDSDNKEINIQNEKDESTSLYKNKLHNELLLHLEKIRQKRAFDAKKWIETKCSMFNDYMTKNGLKACVINLSGGIDSAVTLGLIKYASKMPKSNIKKILAISQPIHSSQWAYDRAHEIAKSLNCDIITIDQTHIYDQLKKSVDDIVGVSGDLFQSGQLRSYMRTPVAFYVAQLLTQSGTPCVVMGTGNKDEDGYLAYFCKAGDGVVDIQLISDIHKNEVYEVGKELNLPKSVLNAPPSADLWPNQTDEDELGFPYDFIELWINYLNYNDNDKNTFINNLSEEAKKQFYKWGEKATIIHNRNKHKLNFPFNITCL